MKPFRLALTLALAACFFAAPSAEATHYFRGTVDNNWSTLGNWVTDGCGGSTAAGALPTCSDDVVICSGTTCNVDITTATCRDIQVVSGVTDFNIQTAKILTVCGAMDLDDFVDVEGSGKLVLSGTRKSDIASGKRIDLEASAGTLQFSADHLIGGAGSIDGANDAAEITIDSAMTFRSEVDITGNLKITGAGSFINAGTVKADNANGTLEIEVTGNIDDVCNSGAVSSSNYRWAVTHASGTLFFDEVPGCLCAHFYEADGDLKAGDDGGGGDDIDVLTCGDLLMEGGTITTGAADSFVFGADKPPAARP